MIKNKELHVEVINQRTSFICYSCIEDLSVALTNRVYQTDVSKSNIYTENIQEAVDGIIKDATDIKILRDTSKSDISAQNIKDAIIGKAVYDAFNPPKK
jgi:hypothetical protein